MKPTDFLRSSLENLAKNFPNVHIKYAFNKTIKTHIVELLPITEYRYNAALDNAWIPLSFDFRSHFPEEEIAFVSSDSTLSIKTPNFEFNTPCIDDIASNLFAAFSRKELKYTFPTYIPNNGVISIGGSISRLLQCPAQDFVESENEFDSYYQAA